MDISNNSSDRKIKFEYRRQMDKKKVEEMKKIKYKIQLKK